METNSTPAVEASVPLYKYIQHIIMSAEGFFVFVGNLLIILSIVINKHLHRKELFLLAGLASVDLIYGLPNFIGSAERAVTVATGKAGILRTGWYCMTKFQTVFYFIGAQATGIMMVVISVDRVLAVVWYRIYMKLTKRYARNLLIVVYSYMICSGSAAFLSSYFQTDRVPRYPSVCIGTWAVHKWYSLYHLIVTSVGGFLSVILYGVVVLAYRRYTKQAMEKSSQNASQAQQKRQKRLTVTLGIVTLCTFLFHSIPYAMILMMNLLPNFNIPNFGIIGPYLWSVILVNSLVNIFVYLWRQAEIRRAIACLLCCRKSHESAISHAAPSASALGKEGSKFHRLSFVEKRGLQQQRMSVAYSNC